MAVKGDPKASAGLAATVEQRRRAMGLTYRELAARSGLSPTAVHKIATGGIKSMPKGATLDALADALGLPRELLRQATAHDFGIREYQAHEGKLNVLTVAARDLSEDDLTTVLAVIQAMRRTR